MIGAFGGSVGGAIQHVKAGVVVGLVEEALRKIASDRVKGVYLDDVAGVQFTLYGLKKELKERGHDMDKSDLIESLKIGNLTSISIQSADGKAIDIQVCFWKATRPV